VLTDGTGRCWGWANAGVLGNNGATGDSPVPVVVTGLTNAIAVTAGEGISCALIQGGSVQCWGSDNGGTLGNGGLDQQSNVPTAVTGLTDAVQISSGESFVCARRATGAVVCWGKSGFGQVGDGFQIDRNVPTAVSGLSGAISIGSAWRHTCAVTSAHTVKCWGYGGSYVLGDGRYDGANALTPRLVKGL
jgi:alpha-tubulin suppressor-like RCC1 family protein